jgi:8-oxo-dGTP pyrophosphatase MutT (NUDIX family)
MAMAREDRDGSSSMRRSGHLKHSRFTFISAVHVFLIRDGHVLLLRRLNTGYEDGNYSVVAGHLDGGEEVVTAAIREAREEVGIELRPDDVAVVGVMHRLVERRQERIDFFLIAERWSGEIRNAEPSKCDQLLWSPLDELPSNVVPYVRRAIEQFRRGIWFSSFGWHEGEH